MKRQLAGVMLGAAFAVALTGLGYGYIVLRAPSPVAVMPTPAAPTLWTPSEPIQSQVMIAPETCYTTLVIQPGKGQVVKCLPSPLPFDPQLKSRGQRRIIPAPPNGKPTEEVIK